MTYRRHTNTTIASEMEKNITGAISQSMCIKRCWHFQRRTRDYFRFYRESKNENNSNNHNTNNNISDESGNLDVKTSGHITFQDIETARKTYTTHRNIMEIERKYINSQ